MVLGFFLVNYLKTTDSISWLSQPSEFPPIYYIYYLFLIDKNYKTILNTLRLDYQRLTNMVFFLKTI